MVCKVLVAAEDEIKQNQDSLGAYSICTGWKFTTTIAPVSCNWARDEGIVRKLFVSNRHYEKIQIILSYRSIIGQIYVRWRTF